MAIGERGQSLVQSQLGATGRTVELLESLLRPKSGVVRDRKVA
jgi:hypothetical protein